MDDLEERLRWHGEAVADDVFQADAALYHDAADRLRTYREALERIELLSTNHGGWFEKDGFAAYAELGNIAGQALKG